MPAIYLFYGAAEPIKKTMSTPKKIQRLDHWLRDASKVIPQIKDYNFGYDMVVTREKITWFDRVAHASLTIDRTHKFGSA